MAVWQHATFLRVIQSSLVNGFKALKVSMKSVLMFRLVIQAAHYNSLLLRQMGHIFDCAGCHLLSVFSFLELPNEM